MVAWRPIFSGMAAQVELVGWVPTVGASSCAAWVVEECEGMTMHISEHDQVIVLEIVDDQCAGVLKALEPHLYRGRTRVVLDLAQARFLNSVNIAALISVRNKVVSMGGKVALANVSANIKAVFQILRLEQLFALDDDLNGAIRALA